MKKTRHHSTEKNSDIRFYIPPQTWGTGHFMREALLGESEELKTTIVDGYADSDGRSNDWNGFDGGEQSSTSSLWDD